MSKKVKISILIVLTIIATFALVHQTIGLHSEIKKVKFPTKQNRDIGNMDTARFISVRKLSRRFNISEEDIFKNLGIVPQKGDESISIADLGKKYNKTLEEMKNNLIKILPRPKPEPKPKM